MKTNRPLLLISIALWLFCQIATAQTFTNTGTAGNNSLFMGTNLIPVSESITNAYTGEVIVLSGTYNVNTGVYNGLAGNDTLVMSNDNDLLTLRLGTNQTLLSIETIVAGNGDDVINLSDSTLVLTNVVINAGAGNDIIWGNAGNDNIQTFDGDDIINGGPGNDILEGGNGNDHFYYCSGNDLISGDAGFDEIVFPAGIALTNLVAFRVPNPVVLAYDITVGTLGHIFATNVEQLRFADGSTIQLGFIPTSQVLPLPAQAGPVISVSWLGQAVSNGLPPATFSIFVSTNGVNYSEWLTNTTLTNALYRGVPGQTNYFYSIATDAFAETEATHATPDTQTFVPSTAPALAAISNATINPGQALTFTNLVISGTPSGVYRFSLDSGPAGANIDSSNGVFSWTPTCDQASTSNLFTVRVTDSGQTNLTDTASFSIVVEECVSPQLGKLVMEAGATGRIPVFLVSTVPLTNLTMRLTLPENLTNPVLQSIAPEICASTVQSISSNQFQLKFGTCGGQFLVGTQQIAWLSFTALTNQASAFLGLSLDDLSGQQTNGVFAANFAPQSGRVVLVGDEPLVELVLNPDNSMVLNLYDHVGMMNVLQTTTNLSKPVAWAFSQQIVLSNLVQQLPLSNSTNQAQYFRSYRSAQ